LSESFVAAVVDQLCKRHPRIRFHIEVSETEWLRRNLLERNVDLLVVRKYGGRSDDELTFEKLYEDPFVVAAGAQSPWARRRKVELVDLTNEWWVMPPSESQPGSFFAAAFRDKGLDLPRVKVVAFPVEVRATLLATGGFLTILPRSVFRFSSKPTLIKELPVALPVTEPVGVLTVRKRTQSPAAQLFIACAREVANAANRRR
jgi:DNA-binding transcriptional LysR family regulator